MLNGYWWVYADSVHAEIKAMLLYVYIGEFARHIS
jgi:hypothetical protein